MASGHWRIGLNIQDNNVFAVALADSRQGWQVRGWWAFSDGMVADRRSLWSAPYRLKALLGDWRATLPRYHQLAVSFPALQTLQRQLPVPVPSLNEPQREVYLALNMARELQLEAGALQLDYHLSSGSPSRYAVTAVKRAVYEPMIQALNALDLAPQAMTPDACALQTLMPGVSADGYEAIVYRQDDIWLWASAQEWGAWTCHELTDPQAVCQAIGLPQHRVAFIESGNMNSADYDPWQVIARRLPPLPVNGGRYSIAIALAIGAGR